MRKMKLTTLLVLCLGLMTACGAPSKQTNEAIEAYQNFLKGDLSLIDKDSVESFFLTDLTDDDSRSEYEYTLIDLDGDDTKELLIQFIDDPGSYNSVFHYENGRIVCWRSDSLEMICYNYPLKNGMMVEEYDYDGSISYRIYHYLPTGETEDLNYLYIREEPSHLESSLNAPIYKIDDEDVCKEDFDKNLKELILDKMLDRSDWTPVK